MLYNDDAWVRPVIASAPVQPEATACPAKKPAVATSNPISTTTRTVERVINTPTTIPAIAISSTGRRPNRAAARTADRDRRDGRRSVDDPLDRSGCGADRVAGGNSGLLRRACGRLRLDRRRSDHGPYPGVVVVQPLLLRRLEPVWLARRRVLRELGLGRDIGHDRVPGSGRRRSRCAAPKR